MNNPDYPAWEKRYLDRKSAVVILAGALSDLAAMGRVARGLADGG